MESDDLGLGPDAKKFLDKVITANQEEVDNFKKNLDNPAVFVQKMHTFPEGKKPFPLVLFLKCLLTAFHCGEFFEVHYQIPAGFIAFLVTCIASDYHHIIMADLTASIGMKGKNIKVLIPIKYDSESGTYTFHEKTMVLSGVKVKSHKRARPSDDIEPEEHEEEEAEDDSVGAPAARGRSSRKPVRTEIVPLPAGDPAPCYNITNVKILDFICNRDSAPESVIAHVFSYLDINWLTAKPVGYILRAAMCIAQVFGLAASTTTRERTYRGVASKQRLKTAFQAEYVLTYFTSIDESIFMIAASDADQDLFMQYYKNMHSPGVSVSAIPKARKPTRKLVPQPNNEVNDIEWDLLCMVLNIGLNAEPEGPDFTTVAKTYVECMKSSTDNMRMKVNTLSILQKIFSGNNDIGKITTGCSEWPNLEFCMQCIMLTTSAQCLVDNIDLHNSLEGLPPAKQEELRNAKSQVEDFLLSGPVCVCSKVLTDNDMKYVICHGVFFTEAVEIVEDITFPKNLPVVVTYHGKSGCVFWDGHERKFYKVYPLTITNDISGVMTDDISNLAECLRKLFVETEPNSIVMLFFRQMFDKVYGQVAKNLVEFMQTVQLPMTIKKLGLVFADSFDPNMTEMEKIYKMSTTAFHVPDRNFKNNDEARNNMHACIPMHIQIVIVAMALKETSWMLVGLHEKDTYFFGFHPSFARDNILLIGDKPPLVSSSQNMEPRKGK